MQITQTHGSQITVAYNYEVIGLTVSMPPLSIVKTVGNYQIDSNFPPYLEYAAYSLDLTHLIENII